MMQQAVMGIDHLTLSIIQVGSMVSTFIFVFSRGLRTTTGHLQFLTSRWRLLMRSLISVDLLVPLIALLVIVLVGPPKTVAVGLILLAASPASPTVLRNITQAYGSDEYAVSFHVALALLAIVTVPVSIDLLSYATGVPVDATLSAVAELVGINILLPMVAGMISGWLFPAMARRISQPLEIFSVILIILLVILLLLPTYQVLFAMDIRSYVAIALMTIGALAAGHLMARGRPEEQTTLALESATRNTGLTLLMASSFTSLEKALPVLIPYVVLSWIICQTYVVFRRIRMTKNARDRGSHR
jgi:bile acid:Na+ symporter, BASS family